MTGQLYRNHTNIPDLEPYYSQHVSAMTAEGLHSKADIAVELAARDRHIADLEKSRVREENNQAITALELTEASDLLSRLVTCADNGYDTAELHDIVAAARGIL